MDNKIARRTVRSGMLEAEIVSGADMACELDVAISIRERDSELGTFSTADAFFDLPALTRDIAKAVISIFETTDEHVRPAVYDRFALMSKQLSAIERIVSED